VTTLPLDPHEGLTIENDVLGVRLWGPPASPALLLGASDIWDRRWFAEQQPLVTLERIRELAFADRLGEIARSPNETIYHLYQRYDFPCPKPGAQIIFLTPFGTDAHAEHNGNSLQLRVTGPRKTLLVEIWASLTRRLVVCDCFQQGLEPADLAVRVYRHRDTILPGEPTDPTIGGHPSATDFAPFPMPDAFRLPIGNGGGVRQIFPPDSTFEAGFEFAAATSVVGLSTSLHLDTARKGLGSPYWAEKEGRLDHGTVKRYAPINAAEGTAATLTLHEIADRFCILATLLTSQDSPDPIQEAASTLVEAERQGVAYLREEQQKDFDSARRARRAVATSNGRILLNAPATILPNLRKKGGYYGDIPMCSVGPTKFCFQDAGLWHADFHLNEIRAEPLLTLGRFEDVRLFADMIRDLLPQAEENAADVYELPGAMYPLVHFPLRCRGIAHTNLTWEQDIGLNGLVAKPLWLFFRYTGDTAFLRDIAYPVMRSCAVFCTAYLSEGEDGRLHIVPTVSPEHWGLTARFERNRDSTSALSLTKYLLNAASKAADLLRVDSHEAERWRAAAGRLAPYPTCVVNGEEIWTDVADAPPIEYNIPVPLSPVFWGDDVGLDSPPEAKALAYRTLRHIRVWEPHRFYLDTCVRPRLGVPGPNAPIVPESLLLSYQSLHIFPGVPPDAPVEMQNFAAEGGFRVSAVKTHTGGIKEVIVYSAFGGVCRLIDPRTGALIEHEMRPDETLRL